MMRQGCKGAKGAIQIIEIIKMSKFLQFSLTQGSLLVIIMLLFRCGLGCTLADCSSCSDGEFFRANSSCYACSTLASNCKTCSNATCIACNETYGLDNTNQCGLCSLSMPNCLTCINSTICSSCANDTHGINTTSNLCQLCPTLIQYCTNCINDKQCTACGGSPLIVLSNNICINCGGAIPNCLKCVNSNHCTLCMSYYALFETAMNSSCLLCLDLMHGCQNCSSATVCVKCSMGRIVPLGCTSVPGCTSVIQNPPISICTSCDFTEFQVLPINGACVCIKGFVAGQYCTEILGCTSIMRNSSGDFCISCNQKGYYYLSNDSCKCLPYFQPHGQLCKQVCGDGRVYVLPCDDGNFIDGDGCSSSCSVETMYSCKAGANNTASICRYEGRIKAELSCVYKLDTANSALIKIKLTPAISKLSKINFSSYVTSNFSASCEVTSIELEGDLLAITITYFQDLESSDATITVGFDPYYIHSPESFVFITFKECNGDQLTYQSVQSNSKQTVTFVSKIFSMITLLLWVFGSYSHKLIGVETLHTLHFIFIMQAFAPRYRPVVIYFSELQNTLNIFQDMLTTSAPLNSDLYQRLNQSSDFIHNFGLVAVLQILVILAFVMVNIKRLIQSEANASHHTVQKLHVKKIKKIQTFIYDFLLFPTLIGFFLSLNISIEVNSTPSIVKASSTYSHVALGILLVFSGTAMVFFEEWKCLFIAKKAQKPSNYRDNYVACYLAYLLSLSLTLSLSLNQLIKYPLFAFVGITGVYLILIVIYRPYQDRVHNVGLFINQTAVLFNLAWLISQEYIHLSRVFDQVIAFALMGCISLVLICSLLRIIFELCKAKEVQAVQAKEPKEGQVQSYDEYQRQMVKAIVAQAQTNINYYRLTSQLLRARETQPTGNSNQVFKQLLRGRLRYKARDEDDEVPNVVYSSITGHIHRK